MDSTYSVRISLIRQGMQYAVSNSPETARLALKDKSLEQVVETYQYFHGKDPNSNSTRESLIEEIVSLHDESDQLSLVQKKLQEMKLNKNSDMEIVKSQFMSDVKPEELYKAMLGYGYPGNMKQFEGELNSKLTDLLTKVNLERAISYSKSTLNNIIKFNPNLPSNCSMYLITIHCNGIPYGVATIHINANNNNDNQIAVYITNITKFYIPIAANMLFKDEYGSKMDSVLELSLKHIKDKAHSFGIHRIWVSVKPHHAPNYEKYGFKHNPILHTLPCGTKSKNDLYYIDV